MNNNWRSVTQSEQSSYDPFASMPFGHFAPNFLQRGLIALCRSTFLKRGVFRGSMSRLILALGHGVLDIRFRGASYRIRGESNLVEYGLLLVPSYNEKDIDFMLEDAPTDACFVDIGCNIGLYSLPLAVARPHGRVVSIDANPKMIARINWNTVASQITNLKVVHTAVSDVEGRGDLVIRKNDVAIVAVQESVSGEMPICTLAAIVSDEGLKGIYGLKIDIEGSEDRALVPYLDKCDRALLPRRIVIEHPEPQVDYPGCTAAFVRHSYKLVARTRNNSLYSLEC
jgi:FkbM family methyltransferase